MPELQSGVQLRSLCTSPEKSFVGIFVEPVCFSMRPVGWSMFSQPKTAGWEKNLQEKRDRVLVAQISGSIRGWISFGRYRDTTEEHASEIFALYVETSARDSCDEEQTAQEELEWCCRELTWTRNVS
ncbi:MAG TPA: hypothetical protein VIM69_10780 [Opitutaceae bacterium]